MDGLNQKTTDREKLQVELGEPGPERIWYVGDAFAQGFTLDEVHNITHIDPWFLSQIKEIVDIELALEQKTLSDLDYATLWELKRRGFSDRRLAFLLDSSESEVRKLRHQLNVRPVYKRVDTCAAEFATRTAYMYSTYEEECEAAPTDRKKIVVLGGGPNRIGQGIEFDYCCVHAALALRDDGFETIMVNCNPETVSTDYDTSDRLYFEPLTLEDVLEIVHKENPVGMIVQYGGQTPLKLARALEANGVPIIGTSPESIDVAEDRERFQKLLHKLGLRQPPNRTARTENEALAHAAEIGYPLVVRPSYVLGGRAMEIVHEQQDLERYMREAVKVSNDSPVLLDRFLNNATEVDVDCLSDGETVFIGGVMEHIEQAGVHSGDSACSLPPYSLSADVIAEIKRQTAMMAKALNVNGLMNVQFAIQGGDVYVLEVNPRASRTVPVSKATGLQLAKIAARMAGRKLADQGVTKEVVPPYSRSRKPCSRSSSSRRGHHPGTGNEVDRRSHGRGQQLRRSLRQVAAGRRRAPAGIRHGVHQREESGQAPRRGSGARPARPGLQTGRHARHGRRDRGRRHSGAAGEQGHRRPSAHRRHGEERRDLAGHQHRRRASQRHRRLAHHPHAVAGRARDVLHDHRRRPRRR